MRRAGRGLQSLTLSLLDEGADGMTSPADRRGAGAAGRGDHAPAAAPTVDGHPVGAVAPISAPSLDLLADIVQRPDLRPGRGRAGTTQTLTAIAQAQKDPNSMAARALPALLYGEDHPYATTGARRRAAVTGFTRDDLVALPRQLAAARQYGDLRRLQPAAGRAAAAARAALRQLGARRRRPRASRRSPRRRPAPTKRRGSC